MQTIHVKNINKKFRKSDVTHNAPGITWTMEPVQHVDRNSIPETHDNTQGSHGNIPGNHGNIPSGHANTQGDHAANIPSDHASIPEGHSNIPSSLGNTPSGHGNIPEGHGNIQDGHGNIPVEENMPGIHGNSINGNVSHLLPAIQNNSRNMQDLQHHKLHGKMTSDKLLQSNKYWNKKCHQPRSKKIGLNIFVYDSDTV